MPNKRVFISYASHDKPFADSLAELLGAHGFKIWYNGHVQAGEEWEQSLKEALQDSNLFIPLVSDDYMKSAFTLFELGGAMGLNKNILPIHLSGDVQKMPFRFKKYQMVDAQKMDNDALLDIIEQQTRSEHAA